MKNYNKIILSGKISFCLFLLAFVFSGIFGFVKSAGAVVAGGECSDGTVYVNSTLRTTPKDATDVYGYIQYIQWADDGYPIGATSESDGAANTNNLADRGSGYAAAYYCKNAERTGGYTDWYLPAKNELNTLYINRAAIGNFNTNASGSWPESYYWSSTEGPNGFYPWYQRFYNGYQYTYFYKSTKLAVRCVRRPQIGEACLSYALTINKVGTGSGTVTGAGTYGSGTVVTATASASAGSTFAGWSEACTGTGTCSVTMTSAKTLTATFNPVTYSLTITKAGDGSGAVTGAGTYNYNTLVTVTATPNATSTFAGWSGDCASFGKNLSGKVTMTSAKTCTATFNILAGTRCTDGTVYVTPTLRTTQFDAKPSDWGPRGVKTYATDQFYGRNNINTLLGLDPTLSLYPAAKVCRDSTANGKTDWYLPAMDELKALHSNKVVIKNFDTTKIYGSSMELDKYSFVVQIFRESGDPADGLQSNGSKDLAFHVRCVRRPGPTEVCSNVLPTVKLYSNPSSILAGASSTLTWNVTNATSCTATTATEETLHWKNSDLATSTGPHTWDTGILNTVGTSTYGIICTGPEGTASATTTVSVGPAPMPVVTISANPPSILAGASSTLTWNVTNATSCTATGAEVLWAGSNLATSTVPHTWPTGILSTVGTHTYGITCIGLGGTASATTTVTVNIDTIANPEVETGGTNPDKCEAVDVSWPTYSGADNYDVICVVGGSNSICSSGPSTSVTIRNLIPSTDYSFIINAYRSGVKIATVTTGPVTSGGDCAGPTGSCSILKSPTSSNVNHTTTWTASSTPSCTGCTYIWSGTDINSSLSTTLNTFPKIYTTVGFKNINVEVKNPNNSPFCITSSTTTVSFTGGTTEER
jgi:hypothetical protein